MMMAKVQDCYTKAVNKKQRDKTFQVEKKIKLDSRILGMPTDILIKWLAEWIGSFLMEKNTSPKRYLFWSLANKWEKKLASSISCIVA